MTAIDMLTPAGPSRSTAQPQDVLEGLTALHAAGPLVVTLYLRLDVQARVRNRYLIVARDAIRRAGEAVSQLGLARLHHEAMHRDLERVEAYLEHSGALPHSPGLAVN